MYYWYKLNVLLCLLYLQINIEYCAVYKTSMNNISVINYYYCSPLHELNLWLTKKIWGLLKICNVSFSNTIIIKTRKFHNKSFNQIYCYKIIKYKNQLQHHQQYILGSITHSLDYDFFIWITGVHVFKILYLREITGNPIIFCFHCTS